MKIKLEDNDGRKGNLICFVILSKEPTLQTRASL